MNHKQRAFATTIFLLTTSNMSLGLDSFALAVVTQIRRSQISEGPRCNFFMRVMANSEDSPVLQEMAYDLQTDPYYLVCHAPNLQQRQAQGNDAEKERKENEALDYVYIVLHEYSMKINGTKQDAVQKCEKKVQDLSSPSIIMFIVYTACFLFITLMITAGAIQAYCQRRMPQQVSRILDSIRPPGEELSSATQKSEIPEVPWGSHKGTTRPGTGMKPPVVRPPPTPPMAIPPPAKGKVEMRTGAMRSGSKDRVKQMIQDKQKEEAKKSGDKKGTVAGTEK